MGAWEAIRSGAFFDNGRTSMRTIQPLYIWVTVFYTRITDSVIVKLSYPIYRPQVFRFPYLTEFILVPQNEAL